MNIDFNIVSYPKKREVTVVLLALAVLLLTTPAPAQYSYFGKSKVQTRDYRFQSFETEHFRVLFYTGGEALAEFAAQSAEDYYAQTSRDLGFELTGKTPLILYLSPSQFSETNVILDIIEEGVGGFSELVKNRIVIPFDGSYNNLHHVIGHELTHIFEFQMFYRSRLAALLGAVDELQIPLWVMEGFAEYQSGWVNVSSDAFMRDLVLNNRLVPLEDLNDGMGYLVYREGESFYNYVAERYGRKKVYEFLHSMNSKRSVDAAFSVTFGVTIERFSEDWQRWLRVKYWPQVVKLSNFDRIAEPLTDHRRDGSVYNTAPALSPSGTKVVMVSDRGEYADVYVLSAVDGRVIKKLVSAGRSGGFEGMHLIRPGAAWSPDEKQVAVVTTTAGRDNLTLVDYPSGKVRRRIQAGFDAVYSPRFSPDGKRLVFVGVKNGFSDLYVLSLSGREPERLTYDMYDDRDPTFSPSGDTVAFVSDRPDEGEQWRPGRYAVWLKPGGAAPRRLTERSEQLSSPEFAHGGEYLLCASADSASNIYVYSLADGRIVRRTGFLGDASYLTLSQDDSKLAFAYYNNVGWDIAVVVDPLERIPADSTPPYVPPMDTVRYEQAGLDFTRVKPLPFSLSLDYATGAAGYSSGSSSGLSGTIDVAFSDMLGNHRFEVATDLYGDILNSNLLLQYWLLPMRVDYGLSLFQYRDYPYYVPGQVLVEEVERGGQVVSAYPFDKFTRAELGLTAYHSQADTYRVNYAVPGGAWRYAGSASTLVSYVSPALVFDNTYWTYDGPARGVRARLAADLALAGGRRAYDPYVDARSYLRLGRSYVLASRLAGLASLGRDAVPYYLGGEDVRGYDWGEFYNDTGHAMALAGLELRFPFIERLKLGFPLPLEFGGIRGVAFADAGMVFHDNMRVWDGGLQDLKVGVGVGVRIQISYFALQFDFAKPLSATDNKGWKFTFGIGSDY